MFKGTSDFFGINHYTTRLISDIEEHALVGSPNFAKDMRAIAWIDESWPTTASEWFRVVPWGFEKLLAWIKQQYGDVPVYITENGYSDHGELDDLGRIEYYKVNI